MTWVLGFVLLAASTSGARILFVIGAVLAAAAALFCAFKGGVESALGWGGVACGLFAAWLLV